MFGVGNLIGALSALVGAGGAFVSVPFMTWCNVAIHKAVATSSALGFPIALAGTVGYLIAGWNLPQMPAGTVGYLFWPGLLVLSGQHVDRATGRRGRTQHGHGPAQAGLCRRAVLLWLRISCCADTGKVTLT
jgi:hypothetical protein